MTTARNVLILAFLAVVVTACGPRVLIATGTTIGMKATPGDAQGGRPPQVTLGYKRAETTFVPTGARKAVDAAKPPAPPPAEPSRDAYSTLASIFFSTQWFGKTELASFVSTGFAARALTTPDQQAPAAAGLSAAPRELPREGGKNSFADALVGAAQGAPRGRDK